MAARPEKYENLIIKAFEYYGLEILSFDQIFDYVKLRRDTGKTKFVTLFNRTIKNGKIIKIPNENEKRVYIGHQYTLKM
jgi:hypothetical protein